MSQNNDNDNYNTESIINNNFPHFYKKNNFSELEEAQPLLNVGALQDIGKMHQTSLWTAKPAATGAQHAHRPMSALTHALWDPTEGWFLIAAA